MTLAQPVSDKINLRAFFRDGYTVLPNAVPHHLLQKLRILLDERMSNGDTTDKAFNIVDGQQYISNLEYLFKGENLACLELLGSPFILEAAETICGEDFFLIQEFAVIKMLGDTSEVLWHQDMLHRRTGNCFIMGIYLDDANAGDGCLRVVPQSHLSGKDICTLKHEPFIEVPARAGDILIHDMMLAHSSGIMTNNSIRKVIYFEFLSFKQAVEEEIYTEAQVLNRMRLVRLAVEYHHKLNPGSKKFDWKNPLAIAAETGSDVHELVSDIHRAKSLGKPSAYCFNEQQGNRFI